MLRILQVLVLKVLCPRGKEKLYSHPPPFLGKSGLFDTLAALDLDFRLVGLEYLTLIEGRPATITPHATGNTVARVVFILRLMHLAFILLFIQFNPFIKYIANARHAAYTLEAKLLSWNPHLLSL